MKNHIASLFLFLLLVISFQNASALPVHISGNDAYIRKGFSVEWTGTDPLDPDWVRVNIRKGKYEKIRFTQFADTKRAAFGGPILRTFTCVIPFDFPFTVDRNTPYALHVPEIGRNWEIYFNGKLIESGMSLKDANGTMIPFKRSNVIAFISPDYILPGKNYLSFRITGDPYADDTGLTADTGFMIDDMSNFNRTRSEIVSISLISLYLFIGLYHLFLYSRRSIDIHHMFFGLFSLSLAVYLFSRSDYITLLIPDSTAASRIEYSALYLLIPFVAAFFNRLHRLRLSRVTLTYSFFCMLLIIITIAAPFHLLPYPLFIWRISAIMMLAYILIDGIIGHFLYEYRRIRVESLNGMEFPSPLSIIGKVFSSTNAGYLLIGSVFTSACAIFDIIDRLFINTGIDAMNYGFLVFTAGMTFGLAKRFQGFYSQIEFLNDSLRKSIIEAREANKACAISEERYRLIIEKSKDIFFTLDREFRIISVNMAVQNLLNIDPENVVGTNIFDLIRDNSDAISTSREFIDSQFEKISATLEPVQFKVNLNTRFASETIEMHISLEHITGAGGNEFICKASPVTGDSLLKHVEREFQQYRIGNFITTAEEVTHRITENLIRRMDQQKVLFIRVALREMIINSIEHGNLGITFEEKTAAMKERRYISMISERQNDPKFTDKKVTISYSLDDDRVCYTITDEGEGFDFKSALDGNISNEANEYSLTHGRGIIIAKNIFDQVSFSKNGSSVELIKYFDTTSADSDAGADEGGA